MVALHRCCGVVAHRGTDRRVGCRVGFGEAQHHTRLPVIDRAAHGDSDSDDDNDAKRDNRGKIEVYLRPVMLEEG